MDIDASWCPVCEQQILPKRIQVPLQPTPPTPAPPPSSPQSSPTAKPNQPPRKTKLRAKGGLVQGTGRLRPNGTIKRTDSGSKQAQQPQLPTQPPAPVKYRTVIDQTPIPLYCSDECRLADLGSLHRGRPVDPHRDTVQAASEYDESRSDTSESSSSSSELSSKQDYSHIPPSVLKLAEYYHFPSLPPPLPKTTDHSSDSDSYLNYVNNYTSGVMMAGQRIRDFCPKPAKKHTGFYPPPPEPKKHIPGWTDNSQGWRSTVYSQSSPKAGTDPSRSPTPATLRAPRRSDSSSQSYSPIAASDEELLTRYSESFTRRSDTRVSRSQPSGSPSSSRSPSSPRRERSLVHPSAQGKLLVPDVKLKINSASSASLSSAASSRPGVRSPLSLSSNGSDEETDTQRCDSAASLPTQTKRPTIETRSWSYDNVKTYPLMPMQRKLIKRKEKRIIDGEEVEVEVEVPEPLKRLFLFPSPLS